ncbi:hypothetical protein S40293_02257 [Stachybotrys chartarum IBT 40293]|nr:hypothetical protein S40293_02257 [Stachybotrys chartarum IBT 40293]
MNLGASMLHHVFWVAICLALSWMLWSACTLYINYCEARKLQVPIRIIPIDHLNKLWLLIDKPVTSAVRRLPGWLGQNNFTRFNYRGWHERDGLKSHTEMGRVFVLVTPARNWLYLADPDALMDMYRRGRDFPRWTEITKMLDVFGGPNIATASGEVWKAHRKAINSCLNEKCHAIVWNEAVELGNSLAWQWASQETFASVGEDTRTLSLNVLCKVLFGKAALVGNDDEGKQWDTRASFRSSLLTVLENTLIILALGPKFFTNPRLPLPASWKRLGEACNDFQSHMSSLYAKETSACEERPGHDECDSTLMSSLIRASQKSTGGVRLTETQIYGTMFVVSFAGHDTTAHLLTYAIFFLAADPSVQDWLREEIRTVLGSKPRAEWSYHADFPRLKRCLAVLYETLRVKTPAAEVKWTSDKTQQLGVGAQALQIPPKMLIIPSYLYVQKAPEFWGPDSLEWKPERWVGQQDEAGGAVSPERESTQARRSNAGNEVLLSPPSRGNYIGWSEGTRDCPAKRFSQVEWVGFLVAMFCDWSVAPQLLENETPSQAQSRLLQFIEDDTEYGGLLLQMMHPEKMPLRWTAISEH